MLHRRCFKIKSYKHLFLGMLSILWGCSLLEPPLEMKVLPSKVYYSSYKKGWTAMQRAMGNYPLLKNNRSQGLIETDWLKVGQAWNPPFEKFYSSAVKYRLILKVVRGSRKGVDILRVTIHKEILKGEDFFKEPKTLVSDGLEERSLLYRIDREIKLDRALDRAQILLEE